MSDPLPPLSEAELQRRYRAQMVDTAAAGRHPSEDVWVRFGCDELDAGERASLSDHIASCAECAEVFRALATVRRGAQAFDPDAPSAPIAPLVAEGAHLRWYGLAAAALLALALGGSAWWRLAGPATEPHEVRVENAPAPQAVPVPQAIQLPAETLPSWAALPAAPAVSLPAALTLVVRGAPADRDAFMSAFGAAIAPYRQGRYAEAATALESVTRTYPHITEAWFYLGVSRLLAGQPADAVEPLRRARGSEVVGDEARWLEAVALARGGQGASAATALRALCEAGGPGSERACAAGR